MSDQQLGWLKEPDIPTIERFIPSNFSRQKLRQKFFEDLRNGDKICAQIVNTKILYFEVKLHCMLSRFRRCISLFMPHEKFPVYYDKGNRLFNVNEYISVCVKSINVDAETLILEADEEKTNSNAGMFTDENLSYLIHNQNLGELLSINLNTQQSALRCFKDSPIMGNESNSVEALRFRQNRRLALSHVKRGAELTKCGKCFEAIQSFNKAINIDEECEDAYVGRGAACAGCENFPAALSDFDKALELDPEHRNAKTYRIEVLIAFGKKFEADENLEEAQEKYERAYLLSNKKNERAFAALKRTECNKSSSSSIIIYNLPPKRRSIDTVVIQLSDDSDDNESVSKHRRHKETNDRSSKSYSRRKHNNDKQLENNSKNLHYSKMAKNETKMGQQLTSRLHDADDRHSKTTRDENYRKLQEMEAFIARLKQSK